MFTQQLIIIVQLTSIAACSATLASLVNRKSWPILALMASMPLLNKLTFPLFSMLKKTYYRKAEPVAGLIVVQYGRLQQEFASAQRDRSLLVGIAQSSPARREVLIFGAKEWILKRYIQLSETLERLREANPSENVQVNGVRRRLFDNMFPQLDTGVKSLIYLFVAFHPEYEYMT